MYHHHILNLNFKVNYSNKNFSLVERHHVGRESGNSTGFRNCWQKIHRKTTHVLRQQKGYAPYRNRLTSWCPQETSNWHKWSCDRHFSSLCREMFLTLPASLQVYTSMQSQLVWNWIKNNPSTKVLVYYFVPVGILVHVADVFFLPKDKVLLEGEKVSHASSCSGRRKTGHAPWA